MSRGCCPRRTSPCCRRLAKDSPTCCSNRWRRGCRSSPRGSAAPGSGRTRRNGTARAPERSAGSGDAIARLLEDRTRRTARPRRPPVGARPVQHGPDGPRDRAALPRPARAEGRAARLARPIRLARPAFETLASKRIRNVVCTLCLDVCQDGAFPRAPVGMERVARASRARHLFLTWEWLHTWWRHVPEGSSLRDPHRTIRIGARRDSTVRAAAARVEPADAGAEAPVARHRRRRLGLPRRGSKAWCRCRGARHDCRAHLTAPGYTLDLSAVPAGSNAALLGGALAQRGWSLSRCSPDVCPFIPMTGRTWDEYLEGVGSGHRSNLRRRLRQLQQDHGLRFEQAESEAQRERALETLDPAAQSPLGLTRRADRVSVAASRRFSSRRQRAGAVTRLAPALHVVGG